MITVGDVIRRTLPNGSAYRTLKNGRLAPSRRRTWTRVPYWPPDLFAVAATLVDKTSSYALLSPHNPTLRPQELTRLRSTAASWRADDGSGWPDTLQKLWAELLTHGAQPLVHDGPRAGPPTWWPVAHKLMALADEASVGLGFVDRQPTPIQDYLNSCYVENNVAASRRGGAPGSGADWLGPDSSSLCILAPPELVCVQPKGRTPQVGCTLRSMSHNLALLPGLGEVRTRWLVRPGAPETKPLNILVVPYPYRITGTCFTMVERARRHRAGRFGLEQTWLDTSGAELGAFLATLVKRAAGEVGAVHGVVLPELALDDRWAISVTRDLGALGPTGLEFFVSGMLAAARGPGSPPRNQAFGALFVRSRRGHTTATLPWQQNKHHRWKLERDQISRYHLGHVLDPQFDWWEDTELGPREVWFYNFRRRASLAVLICEDLARIDPVQPVIRSVGPNLVIALLLDGPQWEQRWPGRYATVLADDPGSSVLTLSSLGMVLRSGGEAADRSVALWKDPTGGARRLQLPQGAHGLLLTLSGQLAEGRSLDGRVNQAGTLRLSLSGVHPVSHDDPPLWARA